MLSNRQEEIWGDWVELLKSEGLRPPEEVGWHALDEWCMEKSRDPEMRRRAPFKEVIVNALRGTMKGSPEDYGLKPSKRFQRLSVSSSMIVADDSAMLAFLRGWNEGSFRELRLLYSKLDHGVRAALVSKFTNSAEEDERQLQAQESISSWIEDKSELLYARKKVMSDHSLDDESVSSFVEQEETDIESLTILENKIVEIRYSIQSGFVNAFASVVAGTASGAPPNLAVDFLEGSMSEEVRGIIERSQSESGGAEDSIALLSSAVEDLKAEFERSIKKSDVAHDKIIEKQSEILELVAMRGHQ